MLVCLTLYLIEAAQIICIWLLIIKNQHPMNNKNISDLCCDWMVKPYWTWALRCVEWCGEVRLWVSGDCEVRCLSLLCSANLRHQKHNCSISYLMDIGFSLLVQLLTNVWRSDGSHDLTLSSPYKLFINLVFIWSNLVFGLSQGNMIQEWNWIS